MRNVDYASPWGKIILLLLWWFPAAMWAGFVLSTLWGWFAVPYGAASIGTVHMAGFALIVRMLTCHLGKGDKGLLEAIGFSLIGPAMTLGFGSILHAMAG